MPRLRNRTNEITVTYRNVCIKIAKRHDVAILDTWDAFKKFEPREVLIDGLHFDNLGNVLLFDALLKLIRATYPELRKEKLPDIAPSWESLV
jgi:lysophospholipase L1-like esterase